MCLSISVPVSGVDGTVNGGDCFDVVDCCADTVRRDLARPNGLQ